METSQNFQREGSVSNAHVGSDFELTAARHLAVSGIALQRNFEVSIGTGRGVKRHRFDLGSASPCVLVECKSHTWTSGGNTPSAKLTVWNEAMYHFLLAPPKYRKIFFVLKDVRRGESLAEYYVRLHGHMIPRDVEVWEYCSASDSVAVLLDAATQV